MSAETASKSYPQRGRNRNPVTNPGAPGRKAHAKLSARIGDYSRMVDSGKADSYGGYKKPGSMQK